MRANSRLLFASFVLAPNTCQSCLMMMLHPMNGQHLWLVQVLHHRHTLGAKPLFNSNCTRTTLASPSTAESRDQEHDHMSLLRLPQHLLRGRHWRASRSPQASANAQLRATPSPRDAGGAVLATVCAALRRSILCGPGAGKCKAQRLRPTK